MDQLIEFAGNHPLLSGGFVAVLLMLLWTEISRRTRGFKELSPVQAVPMINNGRTVVVDISPPAEFNKGHIVGARNFAPSRFANPDAEVAKIAEKPVLVACKSGQTAQATAAALVKMGAPEVVVLKGGMTQWKADNYPVTRD
ncbi:MAG: rhodanese-like domain-containing protein [Xanthomonadales bacterium]|nr:rhodanese-like domain-containing protein [Xanthomonadales bacterium]NIX11851.1 rhodanese-like domain-containing protein [Xanthomonadales bacterium]